jgi:hypothetical protein
MTYQALPLENGLPIISKHFPVVQVQELPVHTRTRGEEKYGELTHGVAEVVGRLNVRDLKPDWTAVEGLSLKRPSSGIGHVQRRPTRPRVPRRSSSADTLINQQRDIQSTQADCGMSKLMQKTMSVENTRAMGSAPESCLMGRRRVFRSQTTHDNDKISTASTLGPLPRPSWDILITARPPQSSATGVVAPPTPPEEDDGFKWRPLYSDEPTEGIRQASVSDQGPSHGRTYTSSHSSSSSRPSEIQLPNMTSLGEQDPHGRTWLNRACEHLGKWNICTEASGSTD